MSVLSYFSSLLSDATPTGATARDPDESTHPVQSTAGPLHRVAGGPRGSNKNNDDNNNNNNDDDDDHRDEDHVTHNADVECARSGVSTESAPEPADDAALPVDKLPSDDVDDDEEVPTAALRHPHEPAASSPNGGGKADANPRSRPRHDGAEISEHNDNNEGGGVGTTIRWFDFVVLALLLVGFMAWMAVRMGVQAASTNGDDLKSVIGIVIVLSVTLSLLGCVMAVMIASTGPSGLRKKLCRRESNDGGDRANDHNKSTGDTGSVTSSSSSSESIV